MPPFPERESSILAKLKKKKGPGAGSELDDGKKDPNSEINGGMEPSASTAVSAKEREGLGLGDLGSPLARKWCLVCVGDLGSLEKGGLRSQSPGREPFTRKPVVL